MFMLSTYRVFLATIRIVCPENGQSYATDASTMGTLDIVPTSEENTFTSAYFPIFWVIVPCALITTMLACESSSVVTALLYLAPPPVVAT